MPSIKIIVVDDHKLFRDGLTALIDKHEDLDVIASLEDGVKLFEALIDNNPDIVLLDLSMPNMNGFDVLKKLKKEFKTIKAIAISMHDDGNYIARCAKLGAQGYLLKNTDEQELTTAIREVYEGNKYFSQEISTKMIDSLSETNSIKKFTKKETEIIKLLAKGFTTKEIATKLYVSTRTVETHRSNMLKKLKVKNTVELINKAKSLDLI
ncbi:response regulator [Flavicella marina]|uniref:response regulator n=1 Tax=Flavicella marina TaxID=1475951 RepID=UPI0012647127|nr:response regulator transcription factor [Flavicella marina]